MISEEQIKKVARRVLGEENKDWYFQKEERHKLHLRRVWLQCNHCQVEHHVLYDLREDTVSSDRMRYLKLTRKP